VQDVSTNGTAKATSHPEPLSPVRPGGAISVIVCAYTDARWTDLERGVAALARQTRPAEQIVMVIDHNPQLLARASAAFPHVEVIGNELTRGLSGARNTGVGAARGDVLAFLDEDAEPADDWLQRLLEPYRDPSVLGTGGAAQPRWPADRPVWFAPEFDWVVGCSYRGLPGDGAVIRNPIGANMSFRRNAFTAAGGFTDGVGRVGKVPLGCEETEFSIRATRACAGTTVRHAPGAVVWHRVSEDRVQWRYFLRRCFAEGMSKRVVSRLVGADSALSSERAYVSRTLPAALRRDALSRRGRRRVPAMVAGLVAAAAGYARATFG
jgi:glucosyl-dolichyl phosphate glucuronosyltransferase